MKYLYAFLNELFSIWRSTLVPMGSESSLFSSITGSASVSYTIGDSLIDDDDSFANILGNTTTIGASSISTAASNALNHDTETEINITQTYIESLNREELLTLQELLQEKQIMIENQSEDQFSKSLNRNTNI